MADISFRNVTKIFPNGKTAVKNVNLEIKSGEFLVLAGPASSGKVTLLRMIAGMEPITSGELLVNGDPSLPGKIKKRNMGMIFQHFTLYPGMKVAENIAFSMKLQGEPEEKIKAAVENSAKLFQLEKVLDCYPRELTIAQKHCVAMARAQVHGPEAFLLVDPLNALEASARNKMRKKMTALLRSLGTTVLYVTDRPEEAIALGARTVVMRNGQIEQSGSVEELLTHPVNLFTAQYMNAPGFETAEVKITKSQTAMEALGDGFSLDVPEEWAGALETGGYVGKKVLMGYTVTEEEDEEKLEVRPPEADSRLYFFNRETGSSVLS